MALPMIRNILVPHVGHSPVMALRFIPPFPFISIVFSLFISFLALHFTQYPVVAIEYFYKRRSLYNDLCGCLMCLINTKIIQANLLVKGILSHFSPVYIKISITAPARQRTANASANL